MQRNGDQLVSLHINGNPLSIVSSFKVLGVTFNDHLKWNDNVNILVKKASKRMNILRILRRSGVPSADLLPVFLALVRSVLEYHAQFGIRASLIIFQTRLNLFRSVACVYDTQVCITSTHFKSPKSLA
jgi:hypothetical protein